VKLTQKEKKLVDAVREKAEGVAALARRIAEGGETTPGNLAAQIEALATQANGMRLHELSGPLSRARVEKIEAERAAVEAPKKKGS